jgi:hypothetical protein
VAAGLAPYEALQTGTINAARAFTNRTPSARLTSVNVQISFSWKATHSPMSPTSENLSASRYAGGGCRRASFRVGWLPLLNP